MLSSTCVLAFFLTTLRLGATELTLPAYYRDGMVFQADQDQTMIWGFTTDDTLPVVVTVRCDLKTESGHQQTKLRADPKDFKPTKARADGFVWEVLYDEVRNNGDACVITIEQEDSLLFLDNVVFGDIWFCSGQSNMNWPMSSIFNATEEVANSAAYTNIRFFQVNDQESTEEEDDLIEGGKWDEWDTPDIAARLNTFSAVCFLFARSMTDRLSPSGEERRVFGLIDASWGGTRIEAWMSQDALDACDIEPNVEPGDESHNSNTYLWNAMVHPFLRHNIYGGLWYQGEANSAWNTDLYNCSFPEKINDWRRKWHGGFVPYGFVQLANFIGPGGVNIRWHQTADYGYSPNPSMENVFMAVAMDTYDDGSNKEGIHPRYKQIIGERLSISGGNVAYNLTSQPTNGPFPASITVNNNNLAQINYDQQFSYNNAETSGFYICCSALDDCTTADGESIRHWEELPPKSVTVNNKNVKVDLTFATRCPASDIKNLGYIWAEDPVKEYLGLPIYAIDEYKLPAAPWYYGL